MCTAGLALGLVGGYAQIQGQKMQTAAAQAEAEANARSAEYAGLIADNNAKIAEMQGEDARLRGQQKQIDLQREAGQVIGQGRTSYAAGNVQVGTGSAMAWEQETAANVARERIAIDRNTDMEQWGFKVQAQNERNQAAMARMGATNARAAGSVAGAAGGIAQMGTMISTARLFADQIAIPNTRKKTAEKKEDFKALPPKTSPKR